MPIFCKNHVFSFLAVSILSITLVTLLVILPSRQSTTQRAAGTADVTVTIDPSKPTTVSAFQPGMSQVDNTLRYPWNPNDLTAVNNVKSLITQAIPVMNQHIMAWGVADVWPDPTTSGPTNWPALDDQMQILLDTKVNPAITFAEAPWWMKGQLQSDGTTKLIPDANGEWQTHTYSSSFTDYRGITYTAPYTSPDPFSARILDNQMSKWLTLVKLICQRYMVAPYNVRTFQVWNELKGYFDPITNQYDYTTSAGDPSGYNAKHGYTYLYNQTYNQIMQVATSLGIPTSQIKVGGPYPVMVTWASTNAGGFASKEPALQGKAYGTYDQRELDVVKYWLQHKTGAGFITVDGSSRNKDGTDLTDPFTAAEKFADVTKWIRSLDNTTYPGAQTLPIWWAEWYAAPFTNITDDYNNAVKTYAMMEFIKAGGSVPLEWGGTGGDSITHASGLWTTTTAGGGQPLPWYTSYKDFHDYFPPGTQLVSTNVSSANVEALASAAKTMLVNKTASTLTVSVNGVMQTLTPYQVLVINTPNLVVSSTPTTIPTPLPGTDLIQNGSFETTGTSWLLPWRFTVNTTTAAATINQVSSTAEKGTFSAQVDITQASNAAFDIALKQSALQLSPGVTYTLTYWAKASTARPIQTLLQDQTSFVSYITQTDTLSTSWQQYTMPYTPTTSQTVILAMNLAQATGSVWIDNVQLIASNVTPTTQPTNTPTVKPTNTPTPVPPTVTPTLKPTNTLTPTLNPTNTPTPVPPTATLTPTTLPTNTPIPPSTLLLSSIFLDGIGKAGDSVSPGSTGNLSPLHPSRTVSASFYNSSGQLVTTKTGTITYQSATSDFTGTVDLGAGFTSGTYTIKVSVPQFLVSQVVGFYQVTQGQSVTLPQFSMVVGDANGDNKLDILDYNMLLGCYSDLSPATNCPGNNKALTDFNDDGNVNQIDYNLFLRELSVRMGQ